MKIQFQYRLRMLFCCTAVVALLAFGFVWWQWWNQTRHMRDLCNAVAVSALDPDTKLIIKELAWSTVAWDNGLIQSLTGPTSIKRVVWKGSTISGCKVYIFDAFVRPVADTPVPPICVVFDTNQNEFVWTTVAPYSSGFLHASLDNNDILTITTVSNWFFGKGIYRYAIRCDSISQLNDGEFVKFDNEDRFKQLPKLMSVDPSLDAAIEQIKRAN